MVFLGNGKTRQLIDWSRDRRGLTRVRTSYLPAASLDGDDYCKRHDESVLNLRSGAPRLAGAVSGDSPGVRVRLGTAKPASEAPSAVLR